MNFFADQRRAKSQTNKLVFMYALTVIFTAVGTVAFAIFVANYNHIQHGEYHMIDFTQPYIWQVFIAVVTIICGTSFFKILILGKGGRYVARLIGANEVDLETTDPLLRRYINVVEEMSIASGTPMPGVYIMEREDCINAFAAGYEIDDAVVAVTKGALQKLNRDELQGVIAHEFSHIFNGDMKLNIKLIGYLYGLYMLGELGRVLINSTGRRSRYCSRRSSRNNGGQIAIVGFAVMVLGYIGYFFASLLKAAISRQREFLADASSVQFTRNPDGIGGALKKIYAYSQGAILESAHANEVSHMFFGDAIKRWTNLYATHPPIEDRLKAVFKGFNMSKFEREEVDEIYKELTEHNQVEQYQEEKKERKKQEIEDRENEILNTQFVASMAALNQVSIKKKPKIEETAGVIDQKNVEFAKKLLNELPKRVHQSVKTSYGSKCLMYAMLIDKNDEIRQRQFNALNSKEQPGTVELVHELAEYCKELQEVFRLPVIEIALPALKKLSEDQRGLFLSLTKKLIMADHKVNIYEFIIYNFLRSSLTGQNKFFSRSLGKRLLKDDVKAVLSFIAHVGSKNDEDKLSSFKNGIQPLYRNDVRIISLKDLSLNKISQSLTKLKSAKIEFKQDFINACIRVVEDDDHITVREYELVRLISEIMLVPAPPIIPDYIVS